MIFINTYYVHDIFLGTWENSENIDESLDLIEPMF